MKILSSRVCVSKLQSSSSTLPFPHQIPRANNFSPSSPPKLIDIDIEYYNILITNLNLNLKKNYISTPELTLGLIMDGKRCVVPLF